MKGYRVAHRMERNPQQPEQSNSRTPGVSHLWQICQGQPKE